MRRKKVICVFLSILLFCSIVFAAGCTKKPAQSLEGTFSTGPSATDGNAGDASLNSLRQAMVETQQVFAVACFGCHRNEDLELPVDPLEAMQSQAPELCEDLPFLLEIPEDRSIGENGDLFCIVPRDEDATVAVNQGIWNGEKEVYEYTDVIYRSESGEPILLFCNNEGWEPSVQVVITDTEGTAVIWYPIMDDNHCADPLHNENGENLFFDFSPYGEMLGMDYKRMKANMEWEAVLPTEDMLIGSTWEWFGILKDGREVSYRVTFQEEVLSVRWNDGIDKLDHEYLDAPWELTEDEGYAVLSIDFRELAGVLRYNLLYSESFDELYVGMDVLQDDMPIGSEPLFRIMRQPVTPDPTEMVGTWELAWTEVEGDRNEAEPNEKIIEITMDGDGLYWINYIDNNFPERSFYNKELVVFPDEIYYGCGNDQWSATVNYTGENNTEYALTVLTDGSLMLQQYWEMDGAPWVAYGWYERIG